MAGSKQLPTDRDFIERFEVALNIIAIECLEKVNDAVLNHTPGGIDDAYRVYEKLYAFRREILYGEQRLNHDARQMVDGLVKARMAAGDD